MTFEKPFVDLRDGRKQCMKFKGHRVEKRTIPGDEPGTTKEVDALVLNVVTLEGKPVTKTFSVLSWKLYTQLEPYIESNEINTRTFCIQQFGRGRLVDYRLEVL